MAQEIKIPVTANVDGAKRAAADLEKVFDSVGGAVDSVADAGNRASQSIERVTSRLEELKRVQESLKRLGIPLSDSDAATFMGRWDGMRSAKGPATARVRQFDNFDGWWHGHEALYSSPREAARHRRQMIATALQGTDYARTRNPDIGGGTGGGDDGGGGDGGGGGGSFGSGIARARSSAMAFGKSMLALAGINSVMGMAGRAIDSATEEGVGTDTLKRRLGDLGVDFERLRTNVRTAGDGLGITFVELARMGQNYARVVGNLSAADQAHIGGSLRLGVGLSRAYGLDPEQGNQFFGTMARVGVARDEQSQRRLALLIGDAVARSGYSGKVDELLGAVADYASVSARATLTAPNVAAYTNALTSIMGKYAGMGPGDAAQLIGQADSAVRRGGAMGDASQNFLYAAMRNSNSRVSPLQAMAMWQGGLFSSESQIFGAGSPLAGMGPAGSNVTTLQKIISTVRKMGGNPLYQAANIQGITGLNLAQSAAFMRLQDQGQLGGSLALLQAAGVDPGTISATGMPIIGQLANARGRGALQGVHDALGARGDLSANQRAALDAAMKAGSDEDVRKALAKVAATLNQEETDGSKTRESIADLNNGLTKVGDKLLEPLNHIRDAVVALAGLQVPGFVDVPDSARTPGHSPYAASSVGKSGVAAQLMRWAQELGMSKVGAAGLLGNAWAESQFDPTVKGDNGTAFGMFQWHADRWKPFEKWARAHGKNPWMQGPQLEWAVRGELGGTEGVAGARFRMAKTAEQAAAAGVRFERPGGGYSALRENYRDANNWRDRLAATQELYASVDINIRQPNGKTDKVTVPLKPVGPPRAAGSQPAPGAAPRVHVAYSAADVAQ